jgi:hypothetical protein
MAMPMSAAWRRARKLERLHFSPRLSWSVCRKAACVDRAIKSRGSKRRRDAVQTRVRGGCSGGGWPRPSGRASFCKLARRSEAERNGWKTLADMPVKHLDMQAAMKTHLSQSTGAGTFDGQHGISLAISSVVADGGHLIRHRLHRSVGRHLRHDRLGNRSQRKARDHQGREQPAYREVALHGPRLSQPQAMESPRGCLYRHCRRAALIIHQMHQLTFQ